MIYGYYKLSSKRQVITMPKTYFSKILAWLPSFADIFLFGHISFHNFLLLSSRYYKRNPIFTLYFVYFLNLVFIFHFEKLFFRHEFWWRHSWSRDYFENLKIVFFSLENLKIWLYSKRLPKIKIIMD